MIHPGPTPKRPFLLCLFVAIGLVSSSISTPAAEEPREILKRIAERCEAWLGPPSRDIESLHYTFDLHGEKSEIEISRDGKRVGRSLWQGITFSSGLRQLLADLKSYKVTLEEDDNELLTLVAEKEKGFRLAIGNGISGRWHGYFTAGGNVMNLQVRRDNLLPVRETYDGTKILYKTWLKVGPDRWVPQEIDIDSGDMVFHMQFLWRAGKLWILRQSDYEYKGKPASVARVTNVVVNGEAMSDSIAGAGDLLKNDPDLIERLTDKEQAVVRRNEVIATMLDRNQVWLEPKLESHESIEYTFRTVREDVDERCFLGRDGTLVMEVSRDGQGKMKGSLGKRRTILSGGEYYVSTRGEDFATLQPVSSDRRDEPTLADQLRRYGLMGVQFDLPMFRYRERIPYARIERKREKEWDGRPCHVVEVSGLGRCYFGAGTMLGFASWSYVPHRVPERETLYIDAERCVPLHETLVPSRSDNTFEIDFKDYVEVRPGQWAPMRIEIESKDYFTCHYNFQLAGDSHWMLKDCVSWFKPDEKSRGEIISVRIDEDSLLRKNALGQVEAAKDLLTKPAGAEDKAELASYPFHIGKRVAVASSWGDEEESQNPSRETTEKTFSGIREVLFTLDENGDLIARCKFVSNRFHKRFPITINGVLLGERGELIGADILTTSVSLLNELLVRDFPLNFGKHEHLDKVERFSVQLLRGADTGAYHGHGLWMRFSDGGTRGARHPQTEHMVWNLADGLTADDPALRSIALERLVLYSKVAMEHTYHQQYDQWSSNLAHGRGKATREALFPRDDRRELVEPLLWLRERTTDERDRMLIVLALGWFGDAKAKPALVSSYEDGSTTERLAAAASLGILGDRRGLGEIVVGALEHESELVRMNAVWALVELGGEESTEALCKALFYRAPWSEPAPGGGTYTRNPYGVTRLDILRALVVLRDRKSAAAVEKLARKADTFNLRERELRAIIELLEKSTAPRANKGRRRRVSVSGEMRQPELWTPESAGQDRHWVGDESATVKAR